MLIFLHFIWATFLSSFTSTEAETTSSIFLRNASLDAKVSNQHLLFQTEVFGRWECAVACRKHKCCVVFSTTPGNDLSKPMTCRGHDSVSVTQTSTVGVTGSRTYFKDNESQESQSSWLQRPCSSQGDCPLTVTGATCYLPGGQCLCQPGYYYSHCRDSCVIGCSGEDLQATFLRYPLLDIDSGDLKEISNCHPSTEIPQSCLDDVNCRAFDFSSEKCFVTIPSSADPATTFNPSTTTDFYQRTCL